MCMMAKKAVNGRLPKELMERILAPIGCKLSIGCGRSKPGEDWIGIDDRKFPAVDIQHDLEVYPWPLPDECVQLAACGLVIEHINPARRGIIRFMDEIWRVLKIDAQVMISTPYAGSPMHYADPTHTCGFVEQTWLYFDPLHPSGFYKDYYPKPWKLQNCTFQVGGIMEIVMQKRREDPSYAA